MNKGEDEGREGREDETRADQHFQFVCVTVTIVLVKRDRMIKSDCGNDKCIDML